jgi:WD40 repeat protein
MRNLTRSLVTFNGEKNSVIKVQWSPFTSCILASGGYGRNVDIWDISKDKKDQEPNYLYRHEGHRSKVLDFDWNQN